VKQKHKYFGRIIIRAQDNYFIKFGCVSWLHMVRNWFGRKQFVRRYSRSF